MSVSSLLDTVYLFWKEPFAEDESCESVSMTSSHTSNDVLFVGLTEVEYNFTDASGNLAQCIVIANVSVINLQDEDLYFSYCPSSFQTSASPKESLTQVNWTEPKVSNPISGTLLAQSHYSGEYFPVGVTDVTYQLLSKDKKPVSCTFSIDVFDDTKPTVFNCPTSKGIRSCRGKTTVQWYEPYVKDNSDRPTRNTQTHYPGKTVFKIGKTEVIYTFLDDYGNLAMCSFTITVHRDGCTVMTLRVLLWIMVVLLFLSITLNILFVIGSVLQKKRRKQT
ncbi:Hyalin [Holothuria leucospilota]|uniref:Hyalin n=1 Tax=Holothuria leucospilota TaxID=206669 RepID=A0A9Q1BTH0_HOLLE|nr:Hyalin [Holothuria leucospilota]